MFPYLLHEGNGISNQLQISTKWMKMEGKIRQQKKSFKYEKIIKLYVVPCSSKTNPNCRKGGVNKLREEEDKIKTHKYQCFWILN